MIVIVCVDDRNGMMFNHRRQSRDASVCQDILLMCKGKKLYMSEYSGSLFEGMEVTKNEIRILQDKEEFGQAEEEAACFIEDADTVDFEGQIGEVILYRWNRKYPADQYLHLDLTDGSWELLKTEEFKGSSHERITRQRYRRIR